MAERRWAEAAAAVFERIAKTCDEAAVQGRLARNLQAIETHCPEILGRLLDDPACTECGIARTSAGELTIVQRPLGGSPVLLTTGVSAEKACQDGVESLSARAEEGTCIALCGVGDGYLLKYLAANPPEMFLDREHAVFVFEPHPEVLLQVLMIHDLSGDDGPFAQRRFQWCLGGAGGGIAANTCLFAVPRALCRVEYGSWDDGEAGQSVCGTTDQMGEATDRCASRAIRQAKSQGLACHFQREPTAPASRDVDYLTIYDGAAILNGGYRSRLGGGGMGNGDRH